MSNDVGTTDESTGNVNDVDVEEAEELFESQEDPSSQKAVETLRIDISERLNFQNGDLSQSQSQSGQSSATTTPLERSVEVTNSKPILKEWSSLIGILARIPVKAQKGLSTFDLKLTCISTIGEEILVIGTNVGVVYWYNRKLDSLDRLRCDGVCAVTCLSCIGTVDYMVAAGNQSGLVTIFQIPRETNHGHQEKGGGGDDRGNKKSQKFHIQDLHKGPVTSLEWSRNGMKLFSGDQTGHVVLTDIDYDLVQIRSSLLLCENYEIVQLSYARKVLLICSTFRSIIYSLEDRSFNQVGSRARKVTSKFGGLIVSSAWEESPRVYSVRPGARLWVADLSSGVVQHTFKFKELILSESQPEIHVIKPLKSPRPLPQDIQFQKLYRYMNHYLVTAHKDVVYIVDPRNTEVIGICKDLRSVLDVAVNRDEIFVLETSRNVIRLSAKPDQFSNGLSALNSGSYSSNTSATSPGGGGGIGITGSGSSSTFLRSSDSSGGGIKTIPDIMSASISDFRFPQEPFGYLTSKLKETSEKVIPRINPLINSIKTVIEADVDIEDGQKLLEAGLPPPVMTPDSGDIAGFDAFTSQPIIPEIPVFVPEPERFQKITNLPFEDVVVDTKPVRRAKKTTRRSTGVVNKNKPSVEVHSDSVSVSSAYSNTSSDNNVVASNANLVRKSSFKSDYTLSSSNSGSEGVGSGGGVITQAPDNSQLPLSFSQSWSGALAPTKTVTKEELHLKEELLARRLKWPELLPESARNSEDIFDDNRASSLSPNESSTEEINFWQVNLKSSRDTRREDRVSISTLVAPQDENTDTDSKTMSLENGSSFGTVIENKILKSEEEDVEEKQASDEEDEHYMDIYTRYRNKDSISSYNSVLSFGPPSGSSHLGSGLSAPGGHMHSMGSLPEKPQEIPVPVTVTASEAEAEITKEEVVMDEVVDSKEKSTTSSEATETNSSSVVLEEMDSIVESKVVTDEHWRRWRLPGPINQICLCDHYILCVGTKGSVYYASLDTVTLHWKTTGYYASSMAISPDGSVVWRIYKGDLFSLTNTSVHAPIATNGIEQWTKLTYKKVVMAATVQKSFGWIVKVDGSLEFCTGILTTTMIPYFETVYTPWPVQEVTCSGHRLWGLTCDGRVVFRTGTSQRNPKGVDWLELRWSLNDVPQACSIACGNVQSDSDTASVWFSDQNGDLYFTYQERDSRGMWIPWKVSASSYVQSTALPESKSVILNSIKGVSKSIISLVQATGTKTGLFLASSNSSVWFAAPDTCVIYGNRNTITGHYWTPLRIDRGLTVPSTWSNIYANSIYLGHGYLWIADQRGNLFYLPPAGGKVQQLDLPMFSSGQILAIAPAPEALWLLSSTGDIYGRCDITTTDCVGKGWRQITVSTLKSSQFIHISCGSDAAWAVDDRGDVYMRMGSLKPPGTIQDMSPAWNKVEPCAMSCKGIFRKVYVGASGNMVWALDNEGQVYVRQAVFPDYPIGTGWLLVKGVQATMLALSDSAVWILTPSGEIFRRHGITNTNFVGDYWRKVPGASPVVAISVSLCDELWAITTEGYLLKHSKKSMKLTGWTPSTTPLLSPSTSKPSNLPVPSSSQSQHVVLNEDAEEEEDWELV